MKNLFVLLLIISLLSACSNTDNQSDESTSTTALADNQPMAAPAPVKEIPAKTNEVGALTGLDEAPEMPESEKIIDNTDKKEMISEKDNLKVKPEKKLTKAVNNIKEDMEDTKSDIDAKIEAEKQKLTDKAWGKEATTKTTVLEGQNALQEKGGEVKEKMEEQKKDLKKDMEEQKEEMKDDVKEMKFSHQIFDDLLRKYVSNTGKVDYAGLKKDHGDLKKYITLLEGQSVDGWSKERKMAYWINAYNANTINLILDNYPVNSINDIAGGKPFDKKIANLGGQSLSLNDIENNIIRPRFKDARIHFAVNCAAKSCPPLWYRAWTADNLNSQLDAQTKSFINNPTFNTIKNNEVNISKIFDWYKDDFGNIQEFLDKYGDKDVDKEAKVSYKEYNWDLNK